MSWKVSSISALPQALWLSYLSAAAKTLQASGQTGLVVLPNVKQLLDKIRKHPESDQRYAICTSGA